MQLNTNGCGTWCSRPKADCTTPHYGWNSEFDLWKFVASVFVVLFHSYTIFGEHVVCRDGTLAVELFFLITGYLFASSVCKDTRRFSTDEIGADTWRFIWKKAKRVLPLYLVGYFLVYLCVYGRTSLPFLKLSVVRKAIFDLLLLREFGFVESIQNRTSWYLADMLAALLLLYPLFRWKKRLFMEWIAPVVALFSVGALLHCFGSLVPPVGKGRFWGPVNLYLVRAIGEICAGVGAFRIAEALRNRPLGQIAKNTLCVVGTVSPFVGFTLIASGRGTEQTSALVFSLFFVFTCLSGSGLSAFSRSRTLSNPTSMCVLQWLGRFGTALYFTHYALRIFLLRLAEHSPGLAKSIRAKTPESIATIIAVYLLLSALVAAIALALADKATAGKSASFDPESRKGPSSPCN